MKRTDTQNKSFHLWCTELATALNDSGQEQRMILEQFKDGFDLPWTQEAIKNICRQVSLAMYETDSTAELTTVQIQKIYEVVDMRISEISGISIAWPTDEPPMIGE